ncbi:MAG: hypothetical protein EXS36_04945 [Pedosphaera sp.]|nr:hypothetical protein [Pedosphaera sp.]
MRHCLLIIGLFLGTPVFATPSLFEDFSFNPIGTGRFVQHTENTDSSFVYEAASRRLNAFLDVDRSSAYYVSREFEAVTDASQIGFSFRFRVEQFDDQASPTAFIGLMTDRHGEDFGDGLTLVLSTSEGQVVANANIDQGDFRFAGSALFLDTGVEYDAIGRYNGRRVRRRCVDRYADRS